MIARNQDVLASAQSLAPLDDGMREFGAAETAKVDLAPYRISARETAIRVRVEVPRTCNGWCALCYSTEWLVLLRVVGEQLVPILVAPMRDSVFTAHCEEGSGGEGQIERTLELAGTSTGGFRDLILKERAARTETRSLRFRWNGTAYTLREPWPALNL